MVSRSGVLAHTLPVGIVRQSSTFNQDIKAIVPQDGYDPEYIALFLVANQGFVLKEGVKRGPTVHSLIANFLEELELPDIPIDQQRQIARHVSSQLAQVQVAQQATQTQIRDARLLRTKIVDAAFDKFASWQPIASVAKVQSGYAFKSGSFKRSGVRLLRNANILPGKIYWDDPVYLDSTEAERYSNYVLEEGDVLISLDRPLISTGIKVARVQETDLPSLLLQRVGRFCLRPEVIDANFLYAFLQSTRFIGKISGHDQSLGVPHISPDQVENVEIPILPLHEQRHIATRLQAQLAEVDALRCALELQQNDLDALPQRILAQVFEN